MTWVSNHFVHIQSSKNLFLFVFSYLYQIAHLGDDDEEPEFSSAMPLEEGDTFFFQPRPLKNLVLVDEQENLSPIMSCQVSSWVEVEPHTPNRRGHTEESASYKPAKGLLSVIYYH